MRLVSFNMVLEKVVLLISLGSFSIFPSRLLSHYSETFCRTRKILELGLMSV
jgi:hypothetical protein